MITVACKLRNFEQLFTTNTGGALLQFPFIAASDNAIQYATAYKPPMRVKKYYSTSETASILGVTRHAIAAARRYKTIRGKRIGKQWVYHYLEIERYRQEHSRDKIKAINLQLRKLQQ